MEILPAGALLRDPRNPDLLNIRLLSADENHLVVSVGTGTRRYRRKETLLQRWLLPARTAVAIVSNGKNEPARLGLVVERCDDADSLSTWTYLIATETGTEVVTEQQLRVLKIDSEDPVDRLEMNAWRGPKRFFARLQLLERTTVWKQDSEGVPAFLGARVEPLFHQIYAARRCLLDRETRFLLADEVGLGKTIEAGLVIQSLLAAKPDLRILVVAPGTTSRQWLAELYARFGGRVFTHVNAVRLSAEKRSRKAAEALLQGHRLIVTTSLLRNEPRALSTVMNQQWDLLVVDEGHHLVNWPDLMASLRAISASATGCLVLTATPGRGDDSGLLELLKLVAPATYDKITHREFADRLEPQRRISEKLLYSEELIAALLARGEIEDEDSKELAREWQGLLPNDPLVVERLARMENGDGQAAQELIAYIQEHYRIDRRIIRTRRRTLAEYGAHYAERTLEQIEYDACPAEVAVIDHVSDLLSRTDVPDSWKALWCRFACGTPTSLQRLLQVRLSALSEYPAEARINTTDPLASDLGPAEEEAAVDGYLQSGPTFVGEEQWPNDALAQVRRWSDGEGRCPGRFVAVGDWLHRSAIAARNKVVVFSQSRAVVNELATYLRSRFGDDAAAVMTHDQGDDELAEVARRFESRPSCLVLVSDEVGAEGRNFQFADAVVHLDQPSVVARIEQRIGRLDRVGRRDDRPVLSVAILGPSDLERAILHINRHLFRVYEHSIGGLEYLLPRFQRDLASAITRGPQALLRLAEQLQPRLDAEEQRVDEAFSFFLDTTRPELDRAKQLSDLIADRTGDEDEPFVREWCKELRVGLIPQDGERVKVEVRAERLDSPLTEIGGHDWIRIGTFVRRVALQNSALQYFAPGHVFVDALIQCAQNTYDARASVFFRDLGAKGRGHVFCLIVGRLGPDEAAVTSDLAPGLVRRAEHFLPTEWVRSAFEIRPNGEVDVVQQGPLLRELLKDVQQSDRKCHPEQFEYVAERVPELWKGLHSAVDTAKNTVLAQKADEIHAAANDMEEALRGEMAYLKSLPESEERNRALRDRETLLASVRFPSVAIDAVAIVIGGESR
jgi:superfamily II DNA or RNA helicase